MSPPDYSGCEIARSSLKAAKCQFVNESVADIGCDNYSDMNAITFSQQVQRYTRKDDIADLKLDLGHDHHEVL